MSKPSKIDQYFKRKNAEANTKSPNIENSQVSLTNSPNFRNPPLKAQRIETNPVITQLLERDPGLRPQIWVHDVNQRDEIRRAYIMAGPYQPRLSEYPKSGPEKHRRRFQSSWLKMGKIVPSLIMWERIRIHRIKRLKNHVRI